MTDYIGITEAQSNPFAPLTSELVKQLRDNPIAIAEGATGAPRVQGNAIVDKEVVDFTLVSAVANVDFTDLSLQRFAIVISGSNSPIGARFSIDGGLSYTSEVRLTDGDNGVCIVNKAPTFVAPIYRQELDVQDSHRAIGAGPINAVRLTLFSSINDMNIGTRFRISSLSSGVAGL